MNRRISVIGLGYVGLPVAATFARSGRSVVAFDIDARRVGELTKSYDRTGEVEPHDLNPLTSNSPPTPRTCASRTFTSSPSLRQSTPARRPISSPCAKPRPRSEAC